MRYENFFQQRFDYTCAFSPISAITSGSTPLNLVICFFISCSSFLSHSTSSNSFLLSSVSFFSSYVTYFRCAKIEFKFNKLNVDLCIYLFLLYLFFQFLQLKFCFYQLFTCISYSALGCSNIFSIEYYFLSISFFLWVRHNYTIFQQYYPGNLQKYVEVPIFSDRTKPSSTKACNTSLTACTTMFFSFGAIFSSSFSVKNSFLS